MSPLHWSMSLVASSSAVEYTRMIWSVPPTTNTLHPEHHHNIEWPRARASHSRMASCVVVVQQQYILARAREHGIRGADVGARCEAQLLGRASRLLLARRRHVRTCSTALGESSSSRCHRVRVRASERASEGSSSSGFGSSSTRANEEKKQLNEMAGKFGLLVPQHQPHSMNIPISLWLASGQPALLATVLIQWWWCGSDGPVGRHSLRVDQGQRGSGSYPQRSRPVRGVFSSASASAASLISLSLAAARISLALSLARCRQRSLPRHKLAVGRRARLTPRRPVAVRPPIPAPRSRSSSSSSSSRRSRRRRRRARPAPINRLPTATLVTKVRALPSTCSV